MAASKTNTTSQNKKQDSLSEAIEKYIDKGFGSMNKNDFEVYIFNEIIKNNEYSGMNDNDLSIELRIPKSKVKRLRYEAGLKYPISIGKLEDELKNCIENRVRIVPNTAKCFEVTIDNELVRQYADSMLKKENLFCDWSFNSEILRLSSKDFEFLLNKFCGEKKVNDFKDRIITYFSSNEENLNLSKKLNFSDLILRILPKITSPSLFNLSLIDSLFK